MFPEERRNKIIIELKQRDFLSLDDLAKILNVSKITIIRDVKILREKGLVKKVHGGIKILNEFKNNFEERFNIRIKDNYSKKLEIAKKALDYFNNYQNIFLDSSSTVFVVATELFKTLQSSERNLITNSPAIIVEALKFPSVNIIATGGELKQEFNIFGGNWVLEFLERINIDSSFISAAGISIDGKITTNNKDLASILSFVIKRSKQVNLLVDSTKFFKEGMLNIADLSDCTRIIIDSDVDKGTLSRIKRMSKVEVIV